MATSNNYGLELLADLNIHQSYTPCYFLAFSMIEGILRPKTVPSRNSQTKTSFGTKYALLATIRFRHQPELLTPTVFE
jgi:hypothetical protein